MTVSFSGAVFATDDSSQNVFYYTQTSLPRKVRFLGRKRDVISKHCKEMNQFEKASSLKWSSVAGVTFYRNENYVIVADIGCQSLKLIRAVKLLQEISKQVPASKLNVYQNLLLEFTVINVAYKKSNLLVITDPFSRTVEIINISSVDNYKI